MQIKPLFIVILLTSFSFLHAQEYTFGVKGGINFNNIGELHHLGIGGGGNPTPTTDTNYIANKKIGAHFGAFAMVINPTALYL